MSIRKELEEALDEILAGAIDQNEEYKRRFRHLVENTVDGNMADSDISEVIRLAAVPDTPED